MAVQKGPANLKTSYVGTFHSPLSFIIWTKTDHPGNITPNISIRRFTSGNGSFFSFDYSVNTQEKSLANSFTRGAAGTSDAEKWQNMAFSWGNIRFVRPFWTKAFLNPPEKWVIHREIKEEQLSIWQHSLVDASE